MSTKTWQEELTQVVYNQEMKPEYRVLFQHKLEQLIMNIRKYDEEELIKMLPEIREIKTDGFGVDFPYNKERNQTVNQIKQIIKDYYGK